MIKNETDRAHKKKMEQESQNISKFWGSQGILVELPLELLEWWMPNNSWLFIR